MFRLYFVFCYVPKDQKFNESTLDLWLKALLGRKILLIRMSLCQKVNFDKMVITSFCRGRAVLRWASSALTYFFFRLQQFANRHFDENCSAPPMIKIEYHIPVLDEYPNIYGVSILPEIMIFTFLMW